MLKELSGMMSLLSNKGKIQEEVQKFQASIMAMTAEGTAGAGYVTVRVNGRMEILNVSISDEALKLGDKEMLEDLIVAATNGAMNRIRETIAQESQKMTANLGLPPGMLGSLGVG